MYCPRPPTVKGRAATAVPPNADTTGEDSGVRPDNPLSRGGGRRKGEADGEQVRGKSEVSEMAQFHHIGADEDEWTMLLEGEAKLEAWEEKKQLLDERFTDAMIEFMRALEARAVHVATEPVVAGSSHLVNVVRGLRPGEKRGREEETNEEVQKRKHGKQKPVEQAVEPRGLGKDAS